MINLGKHWQTLKKLYSATVNKNTAITAGGLAAAVAVPYLANSLNSAEINFGFSRDNLERILQIVPSSFVLRGMVGNLVHYRDYFLPLRILKIRDNTDLETEAEKARDYMQMFATAASLHFAGEYFQGISFGFDHSLFTDVRSIPYWIFNIPAWYLLGRGTLGMYMITKNEEPSTLDLIK